MNALSNRSNFSTRLMTVIALFLGAASPAFGGEASTSAAATGNFRGPGTATASAGSIGPGQGFARTSTRSGNVNFASGVALHVDDSGMCFSASNALAGRFGAALATTFNLCIGRDGSVASSGGLSTADGGVSRGVSAGGFARMQPTGAVAGATAAARSDPREIAIGRTWSHSTPKWRWRS
jgi:hypothetical protein